MSVISIKNLSKKYPSHQALKDLSFEIADKELTVITGLKECGKTTLIRAICGLDSVEKGEIYVDGVLINKLEPKDRDMAVIMPSVPLNPNASVYDNMATGMKLRKYPKEEIDSRVSKAAGLLGLTDYLRRLVKNLTPGQKQRVLLARAISREPKIIIIDDILNGVEQGLRRELRTEIVKLNKRLNINFIYTTSDPVEALTMADKIAFLEDGVLTQFDTPAQIYDKPNTLPIATFFGAPKINLFQGKLTEEDSKTIFNGDGFSLDVTALLNDALKKYVDKNKTVTLAVRAEDFKVDENGEISVTVDECDKWGERFMATVYPGAGENSNYFSVFAELKQGETLNLTVDKNRILLYDTETEMLLS